MNHIFSTISSKYQGETMFCFACVATVFGYILGVNRIIDAVISKHSDEKRLKVIQMLNKYTQTNFGEIAELLVSKNIILSQNNISSIDQSHNHQNVDDNRDENNDTGCIDSNTNETSTVLHSTHNDNQDKLKVTESSSPPSTSEEDYELVKKNENINHSKKSANYFEWLNIF